MHSRTNTRDWFRDTGLRIALLTALVSTGCATRHLAAQNDPRSAFEMPGNFDEAIPTPESVIGHPVGEQAVRYDALVAYMKKLADATPYVTLTPYGKTHEGRNLYYLTIASRQNHERLDEIRAGAAKLADPRSLDNDQEAKQLVENLPGIAWMAYGIHGDELSGTDAAMQLAYRLAAGWDDTARSLREELIIHIDPTMNPDGRERYLTQLQQLTGKVLNTDHQSMQHSGLWSAGRGNHYLFDLNRDWLMLVHPETRGRAAVIQSWNPQLVVDAHEMGSLDTYLFEPPREPFNVHLSESIMKWRRRFSAEHANAFDQYGWSYYSGEWYEEWYPGYTNAWASLNGAVGILYEQAAFNAASVKQRSGETTHYRDAVHHQYISSLANLESLRKHRVDLYRASLEDRRWAVSDRGPFDEVFLLPPMEDKDRLLRFIDLLERHNIEYGDADNAFDALGVTDVWGRSIPTQTFPAGTMIIRSNQPQRRIMHAVLGFDPHPSESFLREERTELENRRGSRLYDVTAWSVPLAYGLDAYWADAIEDVTTRPPVVDGAAVPNLPNRSRNFDANVYGWVISGIDSGIHTAIARLLDAGYKPRVASKAFTVGDRAYQPGAVLLRGHENPADTGDFVMKLQASLNLRVSPVATALSRSGPDLGGRKFELLEPPRVAIATQWPVSTTSFGALWHLLDDRIRLRCSPLNIQHLNRIDLRMYNVLILPHTYAPASLKAVIGETGVKKIKHWIEAGGTLIATGGSASLMTDENNSIGSVRRRRDVLDQLDVYQEAADRERDAGNVQINPRELWGTTRSEENQTTENAGAEDAENDAAGSDAITTKRHDDWLRIFSPQGAIVTGVVNTKHWLCFGVGARLPVFVSGDVALMSKHPVVTSVRLEQAPQLRLSGLLWPEARERLAETAWATVEKMGHGQIILFAADPFFRGYFEGTGRLFLNAVLLGPGMGASPPVPW